MKYLEHLPKLLLVVLFLKGLVLGFDVGSCVVLGIFAFMTLFYEFKTKESEFISLKKELSELKQEFVAVSERTSKLNDSMTGFKMAQGMKTKF